MHIYHTTYLRMVLRSQTKNCKIKTTMKETHRYRSFMSCVRCVIKITHFGKTPPNFTIHHSNYMERYLQKRSNFPKCVIKITHHTKKKGKKLHTSASFIKRSKVCNFYYTVGSWYNIYGEIVQ